MRHTDGSGALGEQEELLRLRRRFRCRRRVRSRVLHLDGEAGVGYHLVSWPARPRGDPQWGAQKFPCAETSA
jgi:hypothetical protein